MMYTISRVLWKHVRRAPVMHAEMAVAWVRAVANAGTVVAWVRAVANAVAVSARAAEVWSSRNTGLMMGSM
jgi:hypothetical protein